MNPKQIKEILSSRSLKATKTRMQVLELVSSYNSAIPFSKIQSGCEGMDRVTLYRTMQSLLDKGIIHKALVDDKDTYYALCGSSCSSHDHSDDHIHFKCNQCEQISCEDLKEDLNISLPGFQIETIQIHLTGVCKNCLS